MTVDGAPLDDPSVDMTPAEHTPRWEQLPASIPPLEIILIDGAQAIVTSYTLEEMRDLLAKGEPMLLLEEGERRTIIMPGQVAYVNERRQPPK